MKLNMKGFAFACAILWVIYVGYIIVLAMTGKVTTPFDCLNQIYLGYLSPNILGLIVGVVIAFVDGFIAGAIFAWIYNRFVKQPQ